MKTFGQAITAFLAFRADRKAPKTKLKHQWLAGCLRTLHSRPLADLTAPDLLKLLRQIEARGKRETATRVAIFTAQVYRHAIREGWCTLNPAGDLKGGLETPIVTSRPGYTDPEQVGRLMRLVDEDGYGTQTVQNALRLLMRTALRPGELRHGLWAEIDLTKAEWLIPTARMKMKRPHLIPLSRQALDVLLSQWEISGIGDELIFPGLRPHRPISDAAMNMALRALQIPPAEHVPHGCRVTFSTLLNELGVDHELIELQLSHVKADKVRAVYDRSQRVPERRVLMQRYSDYLDELKTRAPREEPLLKPAAPQSDWLEWEEPS